MTLEGGFFLAVVGALVIYLILRIFLTIRRAFALSAGMFLTLLIALPATYYYYEFARPNRRDREAQRRTVLSRVMEGGDWNKLEQECRALIDIAPRYNGSPIGAWDEVPVGFPVLTALRPRKVRVSGLRAGGAYASIDLFGMHSTGGRGIPFYYLVVTTKPIKDISSLTAFNRGRCRHLTNLVYEVEW